MGPLQNSPFCISIWYTSMKVVSSIQQMHSHIHNICMHMKMNAIEHVALLVIFSLKTKSLSHFVYFCNMPAKQASKQKFQFHSQLNIFILYFITLFPPFPTFLDSFSFVRSLPLSLRFFFEFRFEYIFVWWYFFNAPLNTCTHSTHLGILNMPIVLLNICILFVFVCLLLRHWLLTWI